VEKAVELTGAAFGCLQIYDYKNDNLIMLSVWPPSQRDQILKKYEIIKRGDGVTGRVAATLGPVWIPNVHQLLEPEQYLASLPNIRTELAVPLRSKSKQLAGVLNVEWDTNTRPDKLQSTRQLEALADIAVMGLSASQISESVQKRAQIGRDKLSVMTELAFGILHNSMHKISLAILNIQDAKRNIDIAGNLIESSTSVSVWKKSKDKMLDILFESDASQGQALGSLRDFQHEWDEFKSKTKDLEINTNAIKVSIEEAVRNAVEGALTRRVLNPSVDVEIQLGSLSGVLMTPSLGLILEQLINNAGESMPDGGRLKIKAQRWEDDPTFVEIQISDSGGGISPEIRPHIFEPFYSGRKEKRASRGLGLYIAQASSEASGGELELLNETIESGTTFTIRLPMDMIEQGD
jgi:signal transduction histidine kinase